MPLITCPDCQREISDSAPSCPGCGRPMRSAPILAGEGIGDFRAYRPRSRSKIPGMIIGAIIIFFVVRFFFGNDIAEKLQGMANQSTYTAPERIYSATAEQILGDYLENEVAADGRYRGALIDVSGVAKSIGKSAGGDMYVTITGQTRLGIRSFQGFFPDSAINDLSAIRKGQRIVIRCRVDGMFINVIGRDCMVLMH